MKKCECSNVYRKEYYFVGPYNVSIEDDSINESLSGSEVECKDKEHKEDTSSSKGKQERHVMTFGTFNAPRRSNCQAKAVLAGTTQYTGSIGGTLLTGIISNVDCLVA